MIDKHVEQSKPLSEEPDANGRHRPFGGRQPKGWRPIKRVIGGAISFIAILAFIARGLQKWLWMREVGYTGVFWTLLSVRWELFCAAFVVALLYLWINLRIAARNGATFRAGSLISESTVADEARHPDLSHGFETSHGRDRCYRRVFLCAHLLCAMGHVSPLSLWRILWVVRSSLRGRCRILSVPSPLL